MSSSPAPVVVAESANGSNPPLRWLLYGQGGWIGSQLTELLQASGDEVLAGRSRVDDAAALEQELDAVKPDRVFCCVGRTHGGGCATIDYLEKPGKLYENVRDNLYAPVLLAMLCKARRIHVSSIATGCIFSYDDEHAVGSGIGFRETDRANFFGSSYSTVKGFTDLLLRQFADSALTLRIRMPITGDRNPRNFVQKIVSYERICSIENSMSVLPTLFPAMIDMARRGYTGTVNCTNPGAISHNEVLEMYREIVDSNFTWVNFSAEDQARVLAAGRSNNLLDTSVLEVAYPDVPPIHAAVRAALVEMRRRDDARRSCSFSADGCTAM